MIFYDKLLIGIVLLSAVLLFVLAEAASKLPSSKWRLAYLIPVLSAVFVLAAGGFEVSMLGAYVGTVVLLTGFIRDEVKVRRFACIGALLLAFTAILGCMLNKGYRSVDYVKDFQDGIASMKAHYILQEQKGVDLNALYEEYLPMFEEADKEHDEVANYIAWCCFIAEFHDGHVQFMPSSEEIVDKAYEQACGNDYGLSLMSLSDGRVAAVNVEKSDFFAAAGIHNGTIITGWDGREVTETAKESLAYRMGSYPNRDNEAFWLPIFAAGAGGDRVVISYLDEAGAEKTIELPRLGSYYARMKETMEIVNQGVETGHMMWQEVSEEAVVLRIKQMMFDSETIKTENYNSMQADIRAKTAEYMAAGKTHLILDLRSNSGGSGQMVKALASLFAPEGEHYYCTDGVWDDKLASYVRAADTGKFVPGKAHYFQGENIWNGPITILVNSDSVSAADHLVMIMQGMENITIAGFTETNGSGQGTGLVMLKSGSLCFSNALLLNQDGSIFIDSGVDRESADAIDVVIPFDEKAVRVLFDEGRDYVLEWVLQEKRETE